MSADTPKKHTVNPKTEDPHSGQGEGKTPPESFHSAPHPDAPPAASDKREPNQRTKEVREWGKFGVEVLTLAVIIVYTIIAYHQWEEMRRSTDSARESFVVGQRPWIGFDGTPVTRQESEHWRIYFTVKNFGLSPALHATLASGAQNVTTPEGLNGAIEGFCSIGEKLTSGEGNTGVAGEHGYALFPGKTAIQAVSVDNSPQIITYLLGCVTYLDQFGKRPIHHTRFCYYIRSPFEAEKPMVPCFAGWSAD